MQIRSNPIPEIIRALVASALIVTFHGWSATGWEMQSTADSPELADRTADRFPATAFRHPASPGLSESELARWLESLPGKGARLRSERANDLSIAGFEGLARLRAPWPADAVLQMAPFDHDGLGIHFWSGTDGVSLYFYEHPRPMWAGYRTTRRKNERVPATHVLLGTDNDRYQRTMRGIVEIRHQGGTLVLSRGDLRLVTVPMAELPSEVIFERRASFRAFTMYRGPSIPEDPVSDGRELLDQTSPAKLRWSGDISMGAKLERDNAGLVRLERPADSATVWSGIRLPETGLYEARIRLHSVDAGTGIYLSDDSGRPKSVIGFQRHSPTGAPVLAFLRPEAPQLECSGEARSQRVSFAGKEQWVRIVAGSGTIKCFVSGDGRNWGRALDPLRGTAGPFRQVGLIAFQAPAESQIAIDRLEVRELDALHSLADNSLTERVPPEVLQTPTRFDSWCELVLNTQPPGIALRDWRMACAVAKLSHGSAGPLGNTILEGLLDDCLETEMPAEQFLKALDQAALIYDGWNAPECHRFTQFYERLGKKHACQGDSAPWTLASRGLLASPLATSAQYQVMPEPLVRAEIAQLITAGRWGEARDLGQVLDFWNRPSRPGRTWPDHRQRLHDFVDWTGNVSASELGELAADGSQEQEALCPVAVPQDRSGINLMSDLDAALKGHQYDDASRLLLATRGDLSTDLLPASGDSNLLVRLPLAIAKGMNEHPEWRNVMRERYEKLARFRIQVASDGAQVEELRLLATQFSGIPAASIACRWLGDRALIEGNFLGALDEFEEALVTALPEQHDELKGRIALARACLGIEPAATWKPDSRPSASATIPPGLEGVLVDLRSRIQISRTPSGDQLQAKKFDPVAWDAEPAGEIQLDSGNGPAAPEFARLDWPGRQLAHVVAGDLLYVSNRKQLICFNLKSNRQLWRVPFVDPEATITAWPMQAFQPVATSNRLYVRTSEKDWLGISCLDAVSGKLRWRTERGMTVLSDPLLLQGNLYFFSVSSPPLDRSWRIDLNTVDPESGAIIARSQVLEMQRTEGRAYSCQMALAGNRLIGSIAGAIFCCDLTGRPVWLRREPWPSMTACPDAPQQTFSNPLVLGERSLVLQAGALQLVCLENRTGNLIWRRPLSEARRLMGSDGKRAYVQTASGLTAVSVTDGSIAWWRSGIELVDACWIQKGEPLLVVQREELPNQVSWPLLTWIDSLTGNDLAIWPLTALRARTPQLSHLIARHDGFLAFFGEGEPPSRRMLIKLTPRSGPAFPGHHDADGVDRWTAATTDAKSRQFAERFLPDWSFMGGAADPGNGLREEFSGVKEVLATLTTSDRPVRFTREISQNTDAPHARRNSKLILEAGHEPSERWRLLVSAGGRELLSTIVERPTSNNNWGKWEVDLAEFEESGARIVVSQVPLGQAARGYWKRIELVR